MGLCNIDDKQNKWLLHIKLEYIFGAKYKKCIALKERKFLDIYKNHNTNKNVIGFQADQIQQKKWKIKDYLDDIKDKIEHTKKGFK